MGLVAAPNKVVCCVLVRPGGPRRVRDKVKTTGEGRLDNEKIGQMAFQRWPDHQIGAVGGKQRGISSVGVGGRLRLALIRMLSGKYRSA